MVSHASGARFVSLIGGTMLSFYGWYADLPVASPQMFGDRTDVPESGNWRDAAYLVMWDSGDSTPIAVEDFHLLRNRQTSDRPADPGDRAARVNLLGLWNTAAGSVLDLTGEHDYRQGVSVLFGLWPFTRLVHVLSAPLGYLARPCIVYRSRDVQPGNRPARHGWERVG